MTAQLDWLLLHHANQLILEPAATRLGTPEELVLSNLACYGNTSAAAIPLTLDEAVCDGGFCPGHLIATCGSGPAWAGEPPHCACRGPISKTACPDTNVRDYGG